MLATPLNSGGAVQAPVVWVSTQAEASDAHCPFAVVSTTR